MSDNPPIIFYLWVVHGGNINSSNSFYPYESKINSVTFYSAPHKVIDATILENFNLMLQANKPSAELCNFFAGNCPRLAVPNKETGRNVLHLPPLTFYAKGPYDTVSNYIGLYRFGVTKSIDGCSVAFHTKIYDWNWAIKTKPAHPSLMGMGQNAFRHYFTYDDLFRYIIQDCEKTKTRIDEISVGIYSCQEDTNSLNSSARSTDLIPKIITKIYDVPPAPLLNSLSSVNGKFSCVLQLSKLYSPATAKPPPLARGIKLQGCELNVLSYYNIVDRIDAVGLVTCMTAKGIPMPKAVDLIHSKVGSPSSINYFILRTDIQRGFIFLLNSISPVLNQRTPDINDWGTILKVYRTDDLRNGHMISLLLHTTPEPPYARSLMYVDPQMGHYVDLGKTVEEQLSNIASALNGFNFIDILFTTSDTQTPVHMNSSRLGEYIKNYGMKFRNRADYAPAPAIPNDNKMDVAEGGGRKRSMGGKRKPQTTRTNRTNRTNRTKGGKRSGRAKGQRSKTIKRR